MISMRISGIASSYDTLKRHMYYAGTHLVNYDPTHYKERATVKTEVENGVVEKFLEKPNGQLDLMFSNTTDERMFLKKRIQHQNREELLQRLNYITGVHYSQSNKINQSGTKL